MRLENRVAFIILCYTFLLLPLHGEVTQPVHRKARQHIADRDKCLAPPIRNYAYSLAPQRVQTTTSAE